MWRALRAAGYSVSAVCGVAPQEVLPVKGVAERSDVGGRFDSPSGFRLNSLGHHLRMLQLAS